MRHLLLTLLFLLFLLDCYNQEIVFFENKLQELSINPYENSDSILYFTEILLEKEPLNETAIECYQFALHLQGMHSQLLKFLNRLVELDSTNLNFYIDRGQVKISLFNDTSGLLDLRRALKSDSLEPSLLFDIGNSLSIVADRKHDSLFNFEWYDIEAYSDSLKSILEREKKLYEREAYKYFERTYYLDSLSFYAVKRPLIILYKRMGRYSIADSLELVEHTTPLDSMFNPLSPLQFYFPQEILLDTINIFNRNSEDPAYIDIKLLVANNLNLYYSGQLYEFQEPLIYKRNDDKEIYRFLWMRSLHKPIVIRLEKTKDKQYIIVKIGERISGYHPLSMAENDTIYLSKLRWKEFISILNNSLFWKTPTIKRTESTVNGGAIWILEGKLHDDYHIVYRHSPNINNDHKFRELCQYILKLSDLDLDEDEIY